MVSFLKVNSHLTFLRKNNEVHLFNTLDHEQLTLQLVDNEVGSETGLVWLSRHLVCLDDGAEGAV